MILLVHMLLGAVVGTLVKNPLLAVVLAFFSHYFLDFFPHVEYSIENIEEKKWKKFLPDFLKILADFLGGITLIFLFSGNLPIVYTCAFFSIVPDGLSLMNDLTKNSLLQKHSIFHQKKIHFLKNKKISIFWRILNQLVIVAVSIILIGR